MSEVLRRAEEQLKRQGTSREGFYGMRLPKAPNSYAELTEMVKAGRPETGFFVEIDEFIAAIGTSENPDEIVSQLPYDEEDGSIIFLLPDSEWGQTI
jgi:hypothetical protein